MSHDSFQRNSWLVRTLLLLRALLLGNSAQSDSHQGNSAQSDSPLASLARTARSLRFLKIEMVITKTVAAMSILTPFYYSIGLNQSQIGLSQSIFTIALVMLNVPTGWLADRFSRKLSNFVGDTVATLALVFYSTAQGFADVLLAEVLLGVALALSSGADEALLRGYAKRLGINEAGYDKQMASIWFWTPAAQIIALTIGGYIGATNPRLAILLSAIPFAAGAILSLFLQESGERLVSRHRNPFKDMAVLTKDSLRHNARLRWLIIAYALGREITHPTIWVFTPIMLLVGVPAPIVGVGWVLNSLTGMIGAWLANRWSFRLKEWQRFAVSTSAVLLAFVVMSAHLSLGTIWLYALLGLSQGWSGSTLLPMVQRHVALDRQATVLSVAKSFSQLLYIPLVWGVSAVGVIDLRLSMVAVVVIFTPLVIVTSYKLATVKDA